MSALFVVVAMAVAVNPFRGRLTLDGDADSRWRDSLIGAGLTLAAVLSLALVADPLLDWLDVSPETWRMAAGVVAIVAGSWAVVFPERRDDDVDWRWTGIVPLFFPYLFTPEVAAVGMSLGADEPAGWVLGGTAVGGAVLVALARLPASATQRAVLSGLSRLSGALLVVVGFALIVSGIREV